MSKKSKHVISNINGGWSVREGGSHRSSKVFETKDEAVRYAKTSARSDQETLYIHSKDGSITERNNYGRDPYPPRDKR